MGGQAHEMPCGATLWFDVAIGSCVRPDEMSPEGRRCDTGDEVTGLKTIEGFTCPGKETIGPQGLLQAHPVFPHPTDCQYFFTCFFGKDPNKFGCSKGQVFDAVSLTCKEPEDVPECGCWYDCGEKSSCPGTCNADFLSYRRIIRRWMFFKQKSAISTSFHYYQVSYFF